MKKVTFISMLIFILQLPTSILYSQSIGIGTTTPDAKAQLDITSTSKGILIPRLTTVQRTGIVNPPKGLLVYDSTSQLIFFHDGTNWQGLSNQSNTWSVTGNSGLDSASNFIGTLDNKPFVIKVFGSRAGYVDSVTSNTGLGFKVLATN